MSVEPIGMPSLAAACAQLARTPARTLRLLKRLPTTFGYAGTLAAVGFVTSRLDTATQERLIRAASTNLDNLGAGRISTLLTSAFVTQGPPTLSWWIVLVALLAAIELSWGSWQAAGVFTAGHVGATLIVAAGLAVGVRYGWAAPEVSHAIDVGISYGVMALIGAVTAGLPPALRPIWVVSWVLLTLAAVLRSGDFTSFGHLCALVIGLGIGLGGIVQARERSVTTAK